MTGFLLFAMGLGANAAGGESGDLRKAVTLYASFDDEVRGDVGAGDLGLSTRTGDPKKGPFVFTKGFDKNVFRIAKGKGIHGGALEVEDVLPDNGRIFFPAKGNLAYRKTGWGGGGAMWVTTEPNTRLNTSFLWHGSVTAKRG